MTIFTNVEQKSYSTCIPIKGFENIREVLYIFASGKSQGSRKAYTVNQKQYNETHSGMLDYYIKNATGNVSGNRFVDMMIWPKFDEWQKKRDHYYKCSVGFDYDGGQAFHKTDVSVLEFDANNQMYGLSINAAYIGKEPEDGLARYLNLEQCLYWTAVNITGISSFDTENNVVFNFDFKILENVPFLNIQAQSIIKQLESLLKANPYEMSPSVELFNDNHLRVILSFDSLSFDSHFKHAWKLTGTILTLPVRKCQYDNELKQFGAYHPAIIEISIRNGESKDLPIWQKEHKKSAWALCTQMYEILRLL